MKIAKLLIQSVICLTLIANSNQKCSERNCPSKSGECIENYCLCAPGYTTFKYSNTPSNETIFCNYAYIYRDWALYFELALPFGVGHFYARRYIHGLLKFILFWFLSFIKVIFKKKVRAYPDLKKVSTVLLWVFGILYVADYCGFFFDFYLDGNRMKIL